MKKIKFAVIGCGHIEKSHAEIISRNVECELVALVDVKDKSLLGIEKYSVPFFSSVEDLLAAELEIDVVNIASSNGFHAEQSMACLDGRKHVVIEKPIALSKQDAERVIFKALHVHRHVFAVIQNRYSPLSPWIK